MCLTNSMVPHCPVLGYHVAPLHWSFSLENFVWTQRDLNPRPPAEGERFGVGWDTSPPNWWCLPLYGFVCIYVAIYAKFGRVRVGA
jgi:hypothetical protein